MTDTTPLLQMRGICKQYPGIQALNDAALEVRAGEVHALLGENGAGKSTLMKILSGAVRRDAGDILLNGQPADLGDPNRARKLGISTIYQELSLVPHLTVAENIFLGKAPTRWPGVLDWPRMRREAARILGGLGVSLDPDARVRQPPARAATDGRGRAGAGRRGAHPRHGRADVFPERARDRPALRGDQTPDRRRRGRGVHLASHGGGVPHRAARHRAPRRMPRGHTGHRRRDRAAAGPADGESGRERPLPAPRARVRRGAPPRRGARQRRAPGCLVRAPPRRDPGDRGAGRGRPHPARRARLPAPTGSIAAAS